MIEKLPRIRIRLGILLVTSNEDFLFPLRCPNKNSITKQRRICRANLTQSRRSPPREAGKTSVVPRKLGRAAARAVSSCGPRFGEFVASRIFRENLFNLAAPSMLGGGSAAARRRLSFSNEKRGRFFARGVFIIEMRRRQVGRCFLLLVLLPRPRR